MTHVGQVLRQRREDLGLSLDDIQAKTKIRKRYIQALEDGDWSILPGEVYGRGFIRSYAEAMELDGFALLKQLDEERQAALPKDSSPVTNSAVPGTDAPTGLSEKPAEPKGPRSAEAPRREQGTSSPKASGRPVGSVPNLKPPRNRATRGGGRGGSHVGQAVTVIVILGALAGGWWALETHNKSANPANTPGSGLNQTNTVAANPTNSTANNAANNSANNTTTPPPPTVQVTTQPFKNGTETYLIKTAQPLNVQMQVTRPCWIQVVKQDSKSGSPAGETVQVNQPKTWTAQQQLTIRIGHYPGVTMTVNGQTVQLPKINSPYDVTFIKS